MVTNCCKKALHSAVALSLISIFSAAPVHAGAPESGPAAPGVIPGAMPGMNAPAFAGGDAVLLNGTPADAAMALWEDYVEEVDLDPRTDLLELAFGKGVTASGVTVSGVSADPQLLSGFLARLATRGIAIASNVRQVPDSEALKLLTWGLVQTSSARIALTKRRLAAGETDRRVFLGSPVRILINDFDGALCVELEDGRVGWMRESDLALRNDMSIVAWNRRPSVVVTAFAARIMSESGNPVRTGVLGVRLPLVGRTEDGGWRVALPDGRKAVIGRDDAEEAAAFERREENARRENPAAFRAAIAKSAEALVASGFSERDEELPLAVAAYRLHDLILEQAPDRMARLGAPLSGGKGGRELRPGDLVFFGDANAKGRDAGVPRRAGVWLGGGRFAAEAPNARKTAALKFDGGRGARANGGMGVFLWAVRPEVSELANPCLLSVRSNPFHQAPPAGLARCRLR